MRDLQNDLWKLCLHTGKHEKNLMSNMIGVARRIYSTGFIISQYFFAIGGISLEGKCLAEILMMNTDTNSARRITKENNKSIKNLKALCSSACVGAFYASRYDTEGVNLSLDQVSEEIDWSTALSLIKYEGVYLFGGRDERNLASNRLICI